MSLLSLSSPVCVFPLVLPIVLVSSEWRSEVVKKESEDDADDRNEKKK